MPIQIHLFLGCLQKGELFFHLGRNPDWKEEKVAGSLPLTEITWQNQPYIGLFVSCLLNCAEIRKKKQEIRNQLQIYCPNLNLEIYPFYLFPQIIIS